jgi:hypothetical protein
MSESLGVLQVGQIGERGSRLNANDRLNLAPYLSSPRVHGLYACGPGQARYQSLRIVKSPGIALPRNSHKYKNSHRNPAPARIAFYPFEIGLVA